MGTYWYIKKPASFPATEGVTATEYCPAGTDDKMLKTIVNRLAHCLLDGDFTKLNDAVLHAYSMLMEKKAERERCKA